MFQKQQSQKPSAKRVPPFPTKHTENLISGEGGYEGIPPFSGFHKHKKTCENKTISDGGITVDFWMIKVHTFS